MMITDRGCFVLGVDIFLWMALLFALVICVDVWIMGKDTAFI